MKLSENKTICLEVKISLLRFDFLFSFGRFPACWTRQPLTTSTLGGSVDAMTHHTALGRGKRCSCDSDQNLYSVCSVSGILKEITEFGFRFINIEIFSKICNN